MILRASRSPVFSGAALILDFYDEPTHVGRNSLSSQQFKWLTGETISEGFVRTYDLPFKVKCHGSYRRTRGGTSKQGRRGRAVWEKAGDIGRNLRSEALKTREGEDANRTQQSGV